MRIDASPTKQTGHVHGICPDTRTLVLTGVAIPVADAARIGSRAIRPFEARSVVFVTDYSTRATYYHDDNGHGESGGGKVIDIKTLWSVNHTTD